ncbi:MAG: hypothetical protein KatS3mg050_5024 [Litorilinea sp.]|nr:MAG: hypothetical protein KatS3mg050_5024 [Litorilinea sp.]
MSIWLQTMSGAHTRFLLKLLLHPRHRRRPAAWMELIRLWRMPRYRPAYTHLLGPPLRLIDAASFLSAYDAIFCREIYRFEATSAEPTILDCGANIGLSVLYFKQRYPRARLIAFEPDAVAFDALSENVRSFGLRDVALHPKAVWHTETELAFVSDGADAGRLALYAAEPGVQLVQTVDLNPFLERPVDLLKLDVEGAETEILVHCRDDLQKVQRLFVEYHSLSGRHQELHRLLTVLAEAGFRVQIQSESVATQPFVRPKIQAGMDLQLNIFATRPSTV